MYSDSLYTLGEHFLYAVYVSLMLHTPRLSFHSYHHQKILMLVEFINYEKFIIGNKMAALFELFQALRNLIEMGFVEKEAMQALRMSRNNQDAAVSLCVASFAIWFSFSWW